MSDTLNKEIEAFEKLKIDLLKHHNGKFVIIKDEKLVGAFDTFDAAAKEALRQFPKDIFLIRQVGVAINMPIPASVAYHPIQCH